MIYGKVVIIYIERKNFTAADDHLRCMCMEEKICIVNVFSNFL
jgi:hypothetical protein